VGGPATAQAAWVDKLIAHCVASNVPIDFASTHVYGNDRSQDVFGTTEKISRRDMVARAVRKVYDQVKHSARPDLPIHWSEYNASFMNEPNVTDAAYMGPWLANNIRLCDGLTTTMSYWTFSDVFEEGGVYKTPFYGGYGVIAPRSIPKPAFYAFRLLHLLGEERLPVENDSALVTRRADGSLAIAVWNYADPGKSGPTQTVTINLRGTPARQATLQRVDDQHGSPLAEWARIGKPASPTREQIEALRRAADPGAPETVPIVDGHLTVTLPAPGLALIEIPKANP